MGMWVVDSSGDAATVMTAPLTYTLGQVHGRLEGAMAV